jgi:hypothetical protein
MTLQDLSTPASPETPPARKVSGLAILAALVIAACVLAGLWFLLNRSTSFSLSDLRADPAMDRSRGGDVNDIRLRENNGVVADRREIRIRNGEMVVLMIRGRQGWRIDFEPENLSTPGELTWLEARRNMLRDQYPDLQLTDDQRTKLMQLGPRWELPELTAQLEPLINEWAEMGFARDKGGQAIQDKLVAVAGSIDQATREKIRADYARRAAAVRDVLADAQRRIVEAGLKP